VTALFGGAVLVAALLAAYANHFHNAFHFDDAHTIVNNAAIQELRNIPLFFRDASTFSALPTNQSYRPLVSSLLAVDYYLAGGLHPVWFHASVFALFALLVLLVSFVARRLLDQVEVSSRNRWIALGAAACYGLHPANADTVNYVIASSEILSTLGVIASFAIYFAFPQWRRYYLFALPAAVATMAKPPAAVFALLFVLYRVVFAKTEARLSEARLEPPTRRRALEPVGVFLICGGMLLFVQQMTPRTWVAGAANAHNYLLTQPYVALLYFKAFFWPTGLSADYDLDPFTTTTDARFWTGCVFVLLLAGAAVLAARSKKTRVIGFGLLWFLVALLSTSALPLAEVMNDHRTFFPYIGLVIAMAGGVALPLPRLLGSRAPKVAAATLLILLVASSGWATWQRNKVWQTEETLWHDVVVKSSRNGRGLMNYGNTLMARGDYKGALDYFHRAKVRTPRYSLLYINLAIAEGATGDTTAAEKDFAEALRLAPSSADSYTFYARYLLAHGRADEALELLRTAVELSPTDLTARGLLAEAEGHAGSEPSTRSPEDYLAQSLQFYREERYIESVVACRRALDLRPGYAEAWNNICAADNKLGRYAEAAAACEQALHYKPDLQLARNNLQYAQARLRDER
jgi:Tfp pilus assembly protein PilF